MWEHTALLFARAHTHPPLNLFNMRAKDKGAKNGGIQPSTPE